jgi:D-arabinose 1-dehydrogenase-like Zn-dependent alcohol dehydrogenase
MHSFDVVAWGAPLKEIKHATPRPRGTEVLVKVQYCGVCHSDAHVRDGYFDLGGGKRLQMSERGMRLPTTLGHEPFGTVIAADAPVGADRLIYTWTGCGAGTRCNEGLDN